MLGARLVAQQLDVRVPDVGDLAGVDVDLAGTPTTRPRVGAARRRMGRLQEEAARMAIARVADDVRLVVDG